MRMKISAEDFYDFLNTTCISTADSEDELCYKDPFVTKEQKKRDEHITQLLEEYVSFYKSKVQHSRKCRYIILVPCISIIVAFSLLLGFLSYRILNTETVVLTQSLVAFITTCVSFISLIIGLLTIVTKYFFPENDEQYITTIVESIQRNDLENKRENARHKGNDHVQNKDFFQHFDKEENM